MDSKKINEQMIVIILITNRVVENISEVMYAWKGGGGGGGGGGEGGGVGGIERTSKKKVRQINNILS